MTATASPPSGSAPPAGGPPPPHAEGLSDFLWNTHGYLNEYIRFADSKAAAVFTIGVAFLGVLWVTNDHLKCATPSTWKLADWIALASMALLLVGLVTAGVVVRPRLTSAQATPGLIFWDRVLRHGSGEKYWQQLADQTDAELVRDAAEHIYDLANIAHRKYQWVAIAINATLAGSLLGAVTFLIRR